MDQLPYQGAAEWSLDEKLNRIAEAGFDGVDIAWSPTMPCGSEAIRRASDIGLDWAIVCFPSSVEEFKEIAEIFAGTSVRYLNIQPNLRPLTVLEGVPYILGWQEIARDAGLTIFIETHRDRMTMDIRYTLQLIDAIPSLRLAADLSHYLVGAEFAWPVSNDDHEMIRRILRCSSVYHGRIASREQVQIPVSFPHHKQWLDLFLGWWEEGFELWRERSPIDDDLFFVTELGPPFWYAITGADGKELSDRWEEALLLKVHAREIWSRLDSAA